MNSKCNAINYKKIGLFYPFYIYINEYIYNENVYILMKMLQKRYGQLRGASRYAELIHFIEFCFKCGNNLSLFLNYLANVLDPGRIEKVMPEPLIDLCFRNMKLSELTQI
uniref:Uncharacterized protein n=1 Tax=Meloidogyne hapla TaxID=6305 RepID=A0A1I8B508_MELHA